MNTKTRKKSTGLREIFIAGIVIAFIVFLLFYTSNITNAGTPDSVRYKYYTSIEIGEGSSLWDIAEEYITDEYKSIEEYIEEVKEINHLEEDLIYEGAYLCIPYYSSEIK